MRPVEDIAELDEKIRKAQYHLNCLIAQRKRWLEERNKFKKLLYKNRKRKQQVKDVSL